MKKSVKYLEKVLQQISKEAGPGSTFLEHLEAQILKIYLLSANHVVPSWVQNIYQSAPKSLNMLIQMGIIPIVL